MIMPASTMVPAKKGNDMLQIMAIQIQMMGKTFINKTTTIMMTIMTNDDGDNDYTDNNSVDDNNSNN